MERAENRGRRPPTARNLESSKQTATLWRTCADASAGSDSGQAILKLASPHKRLNENPVIRPKYDPLASIWHGEDAELLENLLRFYPRKPPKRILDATANGRRFWRASKRRVVCLDIEAKHKPDIVADNTRMPFGSGSFDVVVYDPPHIPNQGKDKSKDFSTRFGLGLHVPKEQGYNFSHTFPPFMDEAWRILRREGVLLCKITDYIHHHRYQWAHVELIQAARAVGFRACDCIVKIRKGPIMDPKWKNAHHTRRQHCFWLVFRKSEKCE
jgi:hypothetical protein